VSCVVRPVGACERGACSGGTERVTGRLGTTDTGTSQPGQAHGTIVSGVSIGACSGVTSSSVPSKAQRLSQGVPLARGVPLKDQGSSPSAPTNWARARWMRRDRAPKRARPRSRSGRVRCRAGCEWRPAVPARRSRRLSPTTGALVRPRGDVGWWVRWRAERLRSESGQGLFVNFRSNRHRPERQEGRRDIRWGSQGCSAP
jgi:hypothetical protein